MTTAGYDAKKTDATKAAEELTTLLAPLLKACQDGSTSLDASTKDKLPHACILCDPDDADADAISAAMASIHDEKGCEMLRPFRVYDTGKAIVELAKKVIESHASFDEETEKYKTFIALVEEVGIAKTKAEWTALRAENNSTTAYDEFKRNKTKTASAIEEGDRIFKLFASNRACRTTVQKRSGVVFDDMVPKLLDVQHRAGAETVHDWGMWHK